MADKKFHFDASGNMLKHILNRKELNPLDEKYLEHGKLKKFSQKEFGDNAGLSEFGYVFYPNSCLKKDCSLHVSLHGWSGGAVDWPENGSNIIHYAASNDLVVLYPFAEKCWYTDQNEYQPKDLKNLHTNKSP